MSREIQKFNKLRNRGNDYSKAASRNADRVEQLKGHARRILRWSDANVDGHVTKVLITEYASGQAPEICVKAYGTSRPSKSVISAAEHFERMSMGHDDGRWTISATERIRYLSIP